MAHAAILTIGDELLDGRVIDTNAVTVSDQLRGLGLATVVRLTCRDGVDEIVDCLRFCHRAADVVIATGGLGPTDDDVTHRAVATYSGVPLELHDEELRKIRGRFEAHGMTMPETNRRQAELPRGGIVVPNPNGTAPGCIVVVGGKLTITLPGVPAELGPMLAETVLPFLKDRLGLEGVVRMRVLKTFGFTESKLGEIVSKIPTPDPRLRVGYRARFPEIHLSLTALAPDEATARAWIGEAEGRVRAAVPAQIWGVDDDRFGGVVGELLRGRGLRMATAESCTGGLVASLMTDIAGSSDYVDRGFVTYTNEAKQQMLGVSAELFEPGGPGAVSERCAVEMAVGARDRAGVPVAVSTTGIAGPGGGTPDKPVGTVWIGLATPEGASARLYRFPGSRDWVRTLTAYVALERLRRWLLGIGGEIERWAVKR
jgi:nicotinamide-nucleotide amidase